MRKKIACALVALAMAGAGHAGEVAAAAEEVHPLLIGAEVPDVTVRDVAGRPVNLRGMVAGKPSVLIFYRGGW